MRSPFPGMDPYLEHPAIWPDLHLTLIVAMRGQLNAHLPQGYLAAADRHVWIEDVENEMQRVVGPDNFIVETPTAEREALQEPTAIEVIPRAVTLPLAQRKGTPYLKIVDAQDRRVITVVEMLSPTNKAPGKDRNAYLAKREEYLAANVNLVEINLLRAGACPPLGKPLSPKGAYYYLICRADEVPKGKLWAFTVRDPLPAVPIPLRGRETTSLDLRACLDRAYEEARYQEDLDYTQPPRPRLDVADARWAEKLLKRGNKK